MREGRCETEGNEVGTDRDGEGDRVGGVNFICTHSFTSPFLLTSNLDQIT